MQHTFPRKPVRPGPAYDFFRQLREAQIRGRPMGSAGMRGFSTTQGVGWDGTSEEPGESSVVIAVRRFRVVTVLADALLCDEWDGTTAGSRVYVAKPMALRRTPFHHDEAPDSEDGIDPWYDYTDDGNQRTVNFADGTSYDESLEPFYFDSSGANEAVNDEQTKLREIVAFKPTGGTGVDTIPGVTVEWEDANVCARHFDIPVRLFAVCVGGVVKRTFIRGSEYF